MSVETCTTIAILCAAFAGFLVFLRREKVEENWKRRFIKKAKNRGAYADAFTIKKEARSDGRYAVIYEYQVGINKYRKKIIYDSGTEYSNKIIIYYNPKNPAQGVCMEMKELYGAGLHILGWSFFTWIAVFFVLECTFGRDNMLGDKMDILLASPQMIVALVFLIALYALEFHWLSKRKDALEERKQKAIAEGRVVHGTMVKSWYKKSEKYRDRTYHAVYVYEVNGRKYKRSAFSNFAELPHMMPFYYVNTPDKVFCDYDDNNDNVIRLLTPILLIFPLAAAYLLAMLLGVDFEMLNNM